MGVRLSPAGYRMPTCLLGERMGAKLVGIVSQDSADSRSLEEALARAGYQTKRLDLSSGALEWIKQVHPDAVMLDTNVEGGGWQLVQTLRLDVETAKIPLLVLSGEDPSTFDEKAPALPRHQRVESSSTPFDAERLVEQIRDLLARSP